MYERPEFRLLSDRLQEPRKFIQLVVGPRQIGKTTTVKQVLEVPEMPSVYASADTACGNEEEWLTLIWEKAREEARRSSKGCVLAIDEIQRIPDWTQAVKRHWDADAWNKVNVKVVLIGSARARYIVGLSESLMGRFEEIRMTHWTFTEMREAFGWTLEQYVYFGGYPTAAVAINDELSWKEAIRSAVVDRTLARDILEDVRIAKAALMNRTLAVASARSGEEMSHTKLLTELQGPVGNVMTLSSYLALFHQSGLLGTLEKYEGGKLRRRSSIPKFQVHNNALCAALGAETFSDVRNDADLWHKRVRSAVGAYLASLAYRNGDELFYWRESDAEVDYVLHARSGVLAIQCEGGRRADKGLEAFGRKFSPNATLIVGSGGMPLEMFLQTDPLTWV